MQTYYLWRPTFRKHTLFTFLQKLFLFLFIILIQNYYYITKQKLFRLRFINFFEKIKRFLQLDNLFQKNFIKNDPYNM